MSENRSLGQIAYEFFYAGDVASSTWEGLDYDHRKLWENTANRIKAEVLFPNQETKPLPCICGLNAELRGQSKQFWVRCTGKNCWLGPTKESDESAIAAWNEVMGRKD